MFQISSAPEQLQAVRQAVEEAGFSVESAELSMVPKVTVEIGDEPTAKKVVRLVEGLEDNDDVQDVYANFDIPEACWRPCVVACRGGRPPPTGSCRLSGATCPALGPSASARLPTLLP